VFGLSYLTESALFNVSLTLAGVMVLAFLAYHSIKDFFSGSELDLSGDVRGKKNFVPGIALTISNPVVLLFWTGIVGADLSAGGASLAEGLVLSLGILSGVSLFFAFLTALIHYGRSFLRQRYFKYVSLVAGLVQLFFCVRFLLDIVERFNT
jgi:threonine/homoserine/homoserine lactone efflux protein